ncbi:MAG TPA: hypothetical protein VIN93_11450 [Bryobacteraceae bacterium]|jgi:hypothetical protein
MIGTGFALSMIPFALLGLLYYAAVIFCVWKFYQMVSKINDNLAGIRQAMNRNSGETTWRIKTP